MADFDFSTIVYLILIALVSIFGSRKKKRQARETTPVAPNTAERDTKGRSSVVNFFEQLEKNLMDPELATKPEQSSRNNPYLQFLSDDELIVPEVIKNEDVGKAQFGKKYAGHDIELLDDDKYANYFDDNKKVMDFDAILSEARERSLADSIRQPRKKRMSVDLRKAVIYSEILNRPSY